MGRRIAPPDPAKRERIDAQSEQIARIIGVDAEEIMIDPSYGVMLKPSQVEALLKLVPAPNTCTCRCMQGSHCGGCGHPGCGYTS